VARTVEAFPMPTGERILELLPRLRWALDGNGPALLPVPAHAGAETARLTTSLAAGAALAEAEDDRHDPTVLVIATSGSTGVPKGALLPASALAASIDGTRRRLSALPGLADARSYPLSGGENDSGSWLLALPAHHIAGMQVLLRSIAAGAEPVILDTTPPFTAELFTAAVHRMPAGRRFTSLVPTQLHRVLADPDATTALTTFTAVLVGGAATPLALIDDAEQAGARVVTTYGMSETCGGCVYDGVPLDGVSVSIDPESDRSDPRSARVGRAVPRTVGRVAITGPVVALGYRDMPRHPAFARDPRTGVRTFLTEDLALTAPGPIRVVGRADDVIVTGGIKIDPAVVESVLSRVTGVADVVVTGVPDQEWGAAVVAVVQARPGQPPDLSALRRAATYAHGPAAAPRHLLLVAHIPQRSSGKADRAAVRELAVRELSGDEPGSPVPSGQVPSGQVPSGQVPASTVPASTVPASTVPSRPVPPNTPQASTDLSGDHRSSNDSRR